MQPLNLPPAPLRIESKDNKELVWDELRKKKIVLTPEEWVRQHWVHHLHSTFAYPLSNLAVERSFKLNGLVKRFDLLAFFQGNPVLVVECKAPHVPITEDVFHQALRYNQVLQAPVLVVSNGLQHYALDLTNNNPTFLSSIPSYRSWKTS